MPQTSSTGKFDSSRSFTENIRSFVGSYNAWVEELLGGPMLKPQSEDEKILARKLLHWVALACMLCGVIWSVFITHHLGLCITSFIPLSFTVIVAPFYIYNQATNEHFMLARIQSLAIIFVPWGIQLSLGGQASGMAILWGILGPLCGLFFLTKRSALRLFIIYIVNTVVAVCLDVRLTNDAELATDDFVANFSAMNIVLPSMVVFMALWYTFSKLGLQRAKVSELLEETELRNKDLVASITYAEYLQNAILPSFNRFQEYHPKSFLINKPKDIVSGDFFWKKKVGSRSYFAVCDSTGHGVPGSMVSIICNEALDRAIDVFQLTDPGVILEKARELVVESFQHSDNPISDGMDIGLCCIDRQMVLFAGAKHSLYVVKNGGGSLSEWKGSRQSVGYSINNKQFTTHVFLRGTGDRLYMTTDGFLDQFGGPENKKFKSIRFKQMLVDSAHLSMMEQEEFLKNSMRDWMSGYEQVDDMCVIGVEL